MRWKIIILYLTCTWLNGTLLQKLAPSLKRDPNRITWPCGKGSPEGSLNPPPTPPPPTPPLYTLLMQTAISLLGSAVSVGFAETRNQDRMNASRSASLRHSGPGLGLNLEPVITSRVQLLTNCYDFSRLPIYFPKFLLQFHLIVPAPYLMNDTAQVFVALILLLPLS